MVKKSNTIEVMTNDKVIDECPVCHSQDIEQLIGSDVLGDLVSRFGKGSYCKNCGVKFQYNTSRLKHVLNEEVRLTRQLLCDK